VNLYFRCTAVGAVTLNEESSAFVWVTLEEALGYKPVFGAEAAIQQVIEQGKGSASTRPGT